MLGKDVEGGGESSHWPAILAKSERLFQSLRYRVIKKTPNTDLSALKGMQTYHIHLTTTICVCCVLYIHICPYIYIGMYIWPNMISEIHVNKRPSLEKQGVGQTSEKAHLALTSGGHMYVQAHMCTRKCLHACTLRIV